MRDDSRLDLLGLQNTILEAVATGMELKAAARLLCLGAEQLAPTAICSILSVDADGLLHPVAAPNLPQHYSDALDGVSIGPNVGSCGTSAFLRRPVEVTDIESDPLWEPYKALALPLGLLACWSSPIKARDGRVIATFAFYYRTRRGPTDLERLIVNACLHLCTIAFEHAEVQDRNHRLAYYDPLTDLPNLRCYNDLMERTFATPPISFGLLLVDIDHLKIVNDTMGHRVGDRLIREVAKRLRSATNGVQPCRLGGDEFAVLVDPCESDAALAGAASAILASMKTPIQAGEGSIVPRVTIGSVLYGIDGTDAETLRQNADLALYHAKENRRGDHIRFEQGLRTSMTRRIAVLGDVDRALSEDRILAHYQPIVRLDTAEIIGLEALARMRTQDGDIVAAGTFAEAFSDSSIACRVTDRMLSRVAGDLRQWLSAGVPFQHVGVNLSPADFKRGDLQTRISAPFEAAGVPLKHLILEVTETVFMDKSDDDVAEALQALRLKGMRVALDDFGTGFASLTHLLHLPVDIIKIDKSFVDRLLVDPPSRAIVEALVHIADKLDMKIVAEGIETYGQAERLCELGCSLGQGYHFSRPVDPQAASYLLNAFAQKTIGRRDDAAPLPNQISIRKHPSR